MNVVVDVGCAEYPNDHSIRRLIDLYRPEQLYGFDPNMDPQPAWTYGGCVVETYAVAAWTFTGIIGYKNPGLRGIVDENGAAQKVPCVDLADFVAGLSADRIVLKLDCEGAEYRLLDHLIDRGVDKRLSLAVVEWHHPDRGRAQLERRIACAVEEWPW